jgi:hypothetical protein
MPKLDATYCIENGKLLCFVGSPRGAQWIAKNSTTNVADTIYYEINRGKGIVHWMIEDGLRVQEDKSRL